MLSLARFEVSEGSLLVMAQASAASSWSLLSVEEIASQRIDVPDLFDELRSNVVIVDSSDEDHHVSAVAEESASSDAVASASRKPRVSDVQHVAASSSGVESSSRLRSTCTSLASRASDAVDRSRSPCRESFVRPTKWGRCPVPGCHAPLQPRVGHGGRSFLGCSKYQARNINSCRYTTSVPENRVEELPRRVVKRLPSFA